MTRDHVEKLDAAGIASTRLRATRRVSWDVNLPRPDSFHTEGNPRTAMLHHLRHILFLMHLGPLAEAGGHDSCLSHATNHT